MRQRHTQTQLFRRKFWNQSRQHYYYIGVKLYTFLILAVLSLLPSIFSALLEDSLFWSYFPCSEYLRSASRTLVGLFDDAFFSGTFPASEYLRSPLEDSWRTLYFGCVFPAILSSCAASSNFYDLRLSRVLAQRV